MKLVVISPEHDDPRETAVLGELFALGLERYHMRKPTWPRERLEAWLRALPHAWRTRLVLHQHHELVEALGLGGVHERDEPVGQVSDLTRPAQKSGQRPDLLTSRSCHDLATLRASLGHYDAVFFSPVFPSVSKPGYGPRSEGALGEISAVLAQRTAAERRTSVLALGGITAETAPRALALGFDGVAVLGAVWLAKDPVAAFRAVGASLLATHSPKIAGKPASDTSPHAA